MMASPLPQELQEIIYGLAVVCVDGASGNYFAAHTHGLRDQTMAAMAQGWMCSIAMPSAARRPRCGWASRSTFSPLRFLI